MVPFSFAGHSLCALSGALFWPARRALLVADLHFEKASWFAMRGQMLPPYDSIATLSELGMLVARPGRRNCGASATASTIRRVASGCRIARRRCCDR